MNRTKVAGFAGAVVMAAGLATAFGLPAAATPTPTDVAPELLHAMQRDLGLDADQARSRLANEARAGAIESSLRGSLGEAFAGAWFDAEKLVVGVTDASRADAVRTAGAEPRVVASSLHRLDAAKAALDRTAAPASVNGWYVDTPTNSLVVEVADDSAQARSFTANAHGVAVRTVVTEKARPLYDVRGGDAWYIGSSGRCSVGFSATGSSGSKHFVTAGHCTESGGTAYGYNRVAMGPIRGSTFNSRGDYGKVDVTSSQWTLRPLVKTASGTLTVRGSSEAAVGASVCRSGSTTGYRCGTIQAKNQTVNYPGVTVGGLTRTSACAEPGDSGGSFITGAGQAQGMTSGGSGNCRSGGTTYFQPVNEALSAYGLRLVTG
ncbi:streptogrisin C [Herbihabitans rhizosphaerae]|uniref:Streptogrisin C n=1 Tax=Herbihabitans rhizosphaerae TaxID=1872711 RepID=A0A4Q7KWT1_9PSEU|nr:S1 family peptidase [Herbihabitans rhizosphaerae]RZS41137.1 streptogrisin C [Herbihabitans rhizosphaerae]